MSNKQACVSPTRIKTNEVLVLLKVLDKGEGANACEQDGVDEFSRYVLACFSCASVLRLAGSLGEAVVGLFVTLPSPGNIFLDVALLGLGF